MTDTDTHADGYYRQGEDDEEDEMVSEELDLSFLDDEAAEDKKS